MQSMCPASKIHFSANTATLWDAADVPNNVYWSNLSKFSKSPAVSPKLYILEWWKLLRGHNRLSVDINWTPTNVQGWRSKLRTLFSKTYTKSERMCNYWLRVGARDFCYGITNVSQFCFTWSFTYMYSQSFSAFMLCSQLNGPFWNPTPVEPSSSCHLEAVVGFLYPSFFTEVSYKLIQFIPSSGDTSYHSF